MKSLDAANDNQIGAQIARTRQICRPRLGRDLTDEDARQVTQIDPLMRLVFYLPFCHARPGVRFRLSRTDRAASTCGAELDHRSALRADRLTPLLGLSGATQNCGAATGDATLATNGVLTG